MKSAMMIIKERWDEDPEYFEKLWKRYWTVRTIGRGQVTIFGTRPEEGNMDAWLRSELQRYDEENRRDVTWIPVLSDVKEKSSN